MLSIKQQGPYRYQRKLIGQRPLSRMYLRLHLRILCDLRSSSTVLSTSILAAQSITWSGPLGNVLHPAFVSLFPAGEHYLVDPGGIEPPSWTLFIHFIQQ